MPRPKNTRAKRIPKSGDTQTIDLPPIRVQPGVSEVLITIQPPPGNAFNTSAPFELHARSSGVGVELDRSSLHFVSAEPAFPHAIPARFIRGDGRIDLDVIAYYCEETESRLCFYQHVHLNLPIAVDELAMERKVAVTHQLGIPEDPST